MLVGAESLTHEQVFVIHVQMKKMKVKFAGRLCLSSLVKCLPGDANGNYMQSNEGGQYFTWWWVRVGMWLMSWYGQREESYALL